MQRASRRSAHTCESAGHWTRGHERRRALYAAYAKAGATTATTEALADEARRRVRELRERASISETMSPPTARLDAIYENARRALYAQVDDSVIRDVCPAHVRVRTEARDRDEYLAHPPAGERIRE